MHKEIAVKIPVSHYELMDISRKDEQRTIIQKYRLLCRIWHPDVVKKWAQEPDLQSCEEIFKMIVEAYRVLSNGYTRIQYDSSLRDSHAATPTECGFRKVWDQITTKYYEHLSRVKVIPLKSESDLEPQQIVYAKQWKLPRDVLAEIFKWVGRDYRFRVAITAKESENLVNQVDLQNYCDFINKQVGKFAELTPENTLTMTKLKAHWQHSDRQLRLLVNSRTARASGQLSKWQERFLLTLENSQQNDYLHNPYLRDLMIILLKNSGDAKRAAKLIPSIPSDIKAMHDPSAICLYLVGILPTAIRESRKPLFEIFLAEKAPKDAKHKKTYYERAWGGNYFLLLYLEPDMMTSFLAKISYSHHFKSYEQLFLAIPSISLQKWLLSIDEKLFYCTVDLIYNLTNKDLEPLFYDNLSRQLVDMTEQERDIYLQAMNEPVQERDEDSNQNKSQIKLCLEFSEIPAEDIKSKINIIIKSKHDKEAYPFILRLLLNKNLKYVTPELIYSIFGQHKGGNKDDYWYNGYEKNDKRSNLKMLSSCNDECINFLTNPSNFIDAEKTRSITEYLADEALTGNDLGEILELCLFLSNNGLVYLLSKGLLFFIELIRLKLSELEAFEQIENVLSEVRLNRAVAVNIYRWSQTGQKLGHYHDVLSRNSIEALNYDMIELALTHDSATIIQSQACLKLMTAIGLANFNRCSTLRVNYAPLLAYLDGLYASDLEKFSSLMVGIKTAFQNNQEALLPNLIAAHLFSPAASHNILQSQDDSNVVGSKRYRANRVEQEQLAKLYRQAQEDDDLRSRLLDVGQNTSSMVVRR